MAEWTPEQSNAIYADGRSVIVSAAAGSGKTSVLIERLIRIIADTENKTEVEKMVIVTFTKAAAAEMKQRLSVALLEKMTQQPSNRWLARQHAFLGMASISTIHSFCFDLIRDNITKLSLSADFRVLDETEQKVFSDTVLKELIDELYETKPDSIRLLRDNFCGNSDKNLFEIIPSIYTNISSIPFYERKFEYFEKLYSDDVYKVQYLKMIKEKLDKCSKINLELIETANKMREEKVVALLEGDKVFIDKAINFFENDTFENMLQFVENLKFKNFPPAKQLTASPEELSYIKIKRDLIKEILKKFSNFKSNVVNVDDDLERHKEIIKVLAEIIIEYDKRLYEYKVKKNAVGFDDAEKITLQLLGECDENGQIIKTPLGEEISKNYEIIMVDEFQDSNDRQDMIFRLLSRNGTPEKYGDNLFFVGDVKQSIYRFRQANPDNFIGVLKSFMPYNKNHNENSYIKLNCNFRSSQQVIDFVNFVFKNIMSEQAGDINYDEDEYLVRGANFFENKRDTHIMLIDKPKKQKDTEALCIARKIRQMLDEGTPVSDGKGGTRPCQMKDFCILMRKKTLNEVYVEALEKLDIEVNCEDASGYLKSREISVLINILRVIDNPMLDIPLTSVLMSPMFTFSADEMSEIRLVNRNAKLYNNIAIILGKYGEEPLYDKESLLYQKLDSFYNQIAEYRLMSAFYTLPEIIQMIYDRTDFTSVIQLYKDADKKRANLRLLLEYANNYETVSGGGIGGFLRYIDKIFESKGDFQSVGGALGTQNTVSIKTMHKSKGLEFPFVFIAETDSKFSKKDEIKPYQFAPEKGIGFRLQNKDKLEKFKTIPYEVVNDYNKMKSLGEEMRLLYVALTRAKERLFITLDISDTATKKALQFAADIHENKGITPSLAGSVNSMSDWLTMCLIAHRQGSTLREIFEIYESYCYDDDFPLSFETVVPDTEYQPISEVEISDTSLDEEVVNKLRENFNAKYDDSLVDVISKLSVSDISKNDETQVLLLKRPDFASDDGNLTPAERGTAIHEFLQFADFEALEKEAAVKGFMHLTDFYLLEKNFEEEKQRLVKYGHITSKQAAVIKKDDIDAFLNSGIYCEMKNAVDIKRERKFLISIEDLELDDEFSKQYNGTDGMLNGIMDMVIEKENSVILVDYKTDKVENVDKLATTYGKQLLLYKKALEKIQDKPVEAAIIYSFYKKAEVIVK